MPKDQIAMGAGIALVCAVGLTNSLWFLENTRKGQRLVRWFGERRGLWVLRTLWCLGIVFGVLVVLDIIRPLRW